jgi:hypothetical protein
MMNRNILALSCCLIPGSALLIAACKPATQGKEMETSISPPPAAQIPKAGIEPQVHSHEDDKEKEDHCNEKEEALTLTPDEAAVLAPESKPAVHREFGQTAPLSGQIYRGAGEASLRHGREKQGFAYASCLLPAEMANAITRKSEANFSRPPPSTDLFTGSLLNKEEEEAGWRAGQRELLWEIKDPAISLQVGDIVTGSVPLEIQPRKALAVPVEAVLLTAAGPVVYLRQENSWLRMPVKTGAQDAGWVEILDGLQEKDEVATRSVDALYLLERKKEGGGGHGH